MDTFAVGQEWGHDHLSRIITRLSEDRVWWRPCQGYGNASVQKRRNALTQIQAYRWRLLRTHQPGYMAGYATVRAPDGVVREARDQLLRRAAAEQLPPDQLSDLLNRLEDSQQQNLRLVWTVQTDGGLRIAKMIEPETKGA